MNKKELEKSLEKAVIELYQTGKSQKQVAKEIGISDYKVRKILRKYGVKQGEQHLAKRLGLVKKLLLKHFEFENESEFLAKLQSLSEKQIKGMIATLLRYEKLQKELKSIKRPLAYYSAMFKGRLKDE